MKFGWFDNSGLFDIWSSKVRIPSSWELGSSISEDESFHRAKFKLQLLISVGIKIKVYIHTFQVLLWESYHLLWSTLFWAFLFLAQKGALLNMYFLWICLCSDLLKNQNYMAWLPIFLCNRAFSLISMFFSEPLLRIIEPDKNSVALMSLVENNY